MNHIEQWHSLFESGIGIKIIKNEGLLRAIDGQKYSWFSYLLMCDPLILNSDNRAVIQCNMVNYLLSNRDFLDDLEGWNGGVTYKHFEQCMDSGQRRITIGHDYCHIWDHERGYDYDIDEIQRKSYRIREQAIEKFKSIGVIE